MIDGDPNDTMLNDYPPGHPAGTDEFVSVGAVLSGRGMGTGGVLGTRMRATGEPTHPVDIPIATVVSTGPIVLIAVDGTSISERVVRTAHRLFGEAATYLAINVGAGPYSQMSWAYVWPVAGPSTWNGIAGVGDTATDAADTGVEHAEAEASDIIEEAGLTQATPLGAVGEPASAIIQAAHHHHADVVVVGSDSRGRLSRVLAGSVERELLRQADFSVLVVAAASVAGQ